MDKIEFDEEKILDALNRSGYLFESEISKKLTNKGYFVESNKVIVDPITGKNREIDLIAQFDDIHKRDYTSKCSAKINFIFEIKNTSSPILLLTEYQNSINDEIWNSIKEFITIPDGLEYFNHEIDDRLIYNNISLYTQYCSFQEKKNSNELMALHPDNIHSGIQKITQYCEEQIEYYQSKDNDASDDYLRHWIYLPILLISKDLYELKIDDENIPRISKTEQSSLIYNYHYDNKPTSCIIKVVTKNGFEEFMSSMITFQDDIEKNMKRLREKQKNNNVNKK